VAWWSDPELRGFVATHLAGFGLGLVVWLASLPAPVPAPERYVLWGVAIAIDLATGLVAYVRGGTVPRHRSHMPERFGLFTLIVLGESIIAVSVGTAQADWALGSAATAAFGFAIAACLWWMYFSRFDDGVFDWALMGASRERLRSFIFGYGHLPVFAGLTAVGVGIRLAIEEAIERRAHPHGAVVLGVGLALYVAALTAVQRAAPRGLSGPTVAGRVALAAAALVLAAFGGGLDALVLVGIAASALLADTVAESLLPGG
jgi:low temperature requirement protein LtrA